MTKNRVEAFSDGVIAVAITLLALDLHVPGPGAHGGLAHALAAQWPTYVAYVVSFLTIGIIWINHHAMLSRLGEVDHAILVLNLLLLLTVVALPFTTALMAAYLRASGGENLAAVVYGGSFLALAISFFVMHRHMLLRKRSLLSPLLSQAACRKILRRNAAGLLPYSVATVAGIFTPYLTLAICAGVALYYALPGASAEP